MQDLGPGAVSLTPIPRGQQVTGGVLTRDSWSGIPGMILSYIIRIKPLQVFPLPGSNPAGAFDFPQDWLTPQTSPAQRREGMERRVTMGDSWWLFCSFFYLWDREDECLKLTYPKVEDMLNKKRTSSDFYGYYPIINP